MGPGNEFKFKRGAHESQLLFMLIGCCNRSLHATSSLLHFLAVEAEVMPIKPVAPKDREELRR